MTVQEIVTRVKSAIDELTQNDAETLITSSVDEQNLERIIIDKIGYALQHVIEYAPLEKLDSSMFEVLDPTELAEQFSIDSALVGQLKLPSDLLRIIVARLSSWSQSPYPESDSSQVYLMQQDPYARGSWDRPVNIITNHGSDRYLEMYSAKTASDTLNFSFIRKPQIGEIDPSDDDDMATDINVPAMLQAAFIYQVAGLTMVAFKEDSASALFAVSQRYLDPNTTTE